MLHEDMTEVDLEQVAYQGFSSPNHQQDSAIAAFVLAKRAQKAGDMLRAKRFREKCLDILEGCKTDTLDGCAHKYVKIAGVFIPELFHEEAAEESLAA